MSLKKQTLLELVMKQKVLRLIIEENPDDPRVDEPKRQLALIEAELAERKQDVKPKNNEDEDGNLTVGLKTLRMKSSQ